MEFLSNLRESLNTGFIDNGHPSLKEYRPEFLTNQPKEGKKILTTLISQLENCEEFWFSVAFATTGGLATLTNTLFALETNNIPGKILVSQYLNFTQPIALKRLKQYKNIEVKIATHGEFHSKGYLFKKREMYNLIIGSSNLTQTALSTNKEWNLKVSASATSEIIDKALKEFEKEFLEAEEITESYLSKYEEIWKAQRSVRKTISIENEKIELLKVRPNQMQTEALRSLEKLRLEGNNKALLISATGTGKTYLSAFDVQRYKPRKFLFLVHRLTIAKKSKKTFQSLLGNDVSMGIFSGTQRDLGADYIFSTVQTISKEHNLNLFDPAHFDYIVIDETHRAAASTYQKITDYFSPHFLLGMTATPERTDGADIFKMFDHNIAYEIRLNQALEEKMLSPFHYYGITDLTVDGKEVGQDTDFNLLTADERVDRIIEISDRYGCDNGVVRGLIFCSKNDISLKLSDEFNLRGFKTVALSGASSEEERQLAIKRLESDDPSDKLDYIFSVDIFNEGIDIPKANQIIMLRPTESAIIFVQQLGRGLRKIDGKEYLTVLDFIGNYKNNYLVPIALYGDTTYNKDNLRKLLATGSSFLPGVSTVNFDKISKEKIYASIDSAQMQLKSELVQDYKLLKFKLGRIPMMVDYIKHGARDPWLFATYKKSYLNFINLVENDYKETIPADLMKLLEFFTLEVNNAKRVEESMLLKVLLDKNEIEISDFIDLIFSTYGYNIDTETIDSILLNLNFLFIRQDYKCIRIEDKTLTIDEDLQRALKNRTFKTFLTDSINYSIETFNAKFDIQLFQKGFIRYQKYGRKDVCRLLNWPLDISSTLYGYRTNNGITPCFVTYHKKEELEGDINYNDHFINQSVFAWESRSNRKLTSKEIQNVLHSERILLLIKKEDGEGSDFYYLGDVSIIPDSVEQGTMKDTESPVVHFKYQLDYPVEESLYNYLVNEK